MPQVTSYAFDVTGELPANLVRGEEHVLTGQNSQDFQIIVPRYAPYFIDSLVLTFRNPDGTVRPLQRGRDWVYSHWFWEASHSLAKPVFGSITFTDRSLTGIVVIDYQTLGGDWLIDMNKIEEMLSDRIHNPRVTTWEEVVSIPYQFPVIAHDFNTTDIYFWDKKVMEGLTKIEEAIRQRAADNSVGGGVPGGGGNNTGLTKRALGLDKVRNLSTLPLDVTLNSSDEFYLTPASLANLMEHMYTRDLAGNATFLNAVRNQLSFYTKQETDERLGNKLNADATAVNAAKLGDRDTNALKNFILQGTADNSNKLNGKTEEEMINTILQGVSSQTQTQITRALSNLSTSGGGELNIKTVSAMPNNQNSYTFDCARYSYFKLSIDHVPQVTFTNMPRGKAIEITVEVDTSMPAKTSLTGYESNIFQFTQKFYYIADANANRPGKKIMKISSSDGGTTLFVRVFAAPTLFN